MDSRNTLVLLGLDVRQNLNEEKVQEYISRLTLVVSWKIPQLREHAFMMMDNSIPEEAGELIKLNVPNLLRVKHSFVSTNDSRPTFQRINKHFEENKGSTLIVMVEKKKSAVLEFFGAAKESVNPTHFLNILTF